MSRVLCTLVLCYTALGRVLEDEAGKLSGPGFWSDFLVKEFDVKDIGFSSNSNRNNRKRLKNFLSNQK